jgi:hypothetical protein
VAERLACCDDEVAAEIVRYEAAALRQYLAKPGNRGAWFWLRSKDFSPSERVRILTAVHDEAHP